MIRTLHQNRVFNVMIVAANFFSLNCELIKSRIFRFLLLASMNYHTIFQFNFFVYIFISNWAFSGNRWLSRISAGPFCLEPSFNWTGESWLRKSEQKGCSISGRVKLLNFNFLFNKFVVLNCSNLRQTDILLKSLIFKFVILGRLHFFEFTQVNYIYKVFLVVIWSVVRVLRYFKTPLNVHFIIFNKWC